MPDLKWDDDLAAAAAKASAKCEFSRTPNSPYGENIYYGSDRFHKDGITAATKAIERWQKQINNVDADWDCILNRPDATCDHYSQMVWAKTTKVSPRLTIRKIAI